MSDENVLSSTMPPHPSYPSQLDDSFQINHETQPKCPVQSPREITKMEFQPTWARLYPVLPTISNLMESLYSSYRNDSIQRTLITTKLDNPSQAGYLVEPKVSTESHRANQLVPILSQTKSPDKPKDICLKRNSIRRCLNSSLCGDLPSEQKINITPSENPTLAEIPNRVDCSAEMKSQTDPENLTLLEKKFETTQEDLVAFSAIQPMKEVAVDIDDPESNTENYRIKPYNEFLDLNIRKSFTVKVLMTLTIQSMLWLAVSLFFVLNETLKQLVSEYMYAVCPVALALSFSSVTPMIFCAPFRTIPACCYIFFGFFTVMQGFLIGVLSVPSLFVPSFVAGMFIFFLTVGITAAGSKLQRYDLDDKLFRGFLISIPIIILKMITCCTFSGLPIVAVIFEDIFCIVVGFNSLLVYSLFLENAGQRYPATEQQYLYVALFIYYDTFNLYAHCVNLRAIIVNCLPSFSHVCKTIVKNKMGF